MPTPTHEDRERTLDLINDEIDKRIAQQGVSASSIDTKTTLVMGFVVIGVQQFIGLDHAQPWATLAGIAWAVAFLAGLRAIWLRKYQTVPKPDEVVKFYNENKAKDVPEKLRERTLGTLVATKADAVKQISQQDDRKAVWWRTAVVAFGVAVLLSALSQLEASNGRHAERRPGLTPSSAATSSSRPG